MRSLIWNLKAPPNTGDFTVEIRRYRKWEEVGGVGGLVGDGGVYCQPSSPRGFEVQAATSRALNLASLARAKGSGANRLRFQRFIVF